MGSALAPVRWPNAVRSRIVLRFRRLRRSSNCHRQVCLHRGCWSSPLNELLYPQMALFCKFRSVRPIAFFLLLISAGSPASGPSDIGPSGLGDAYVHVHDRGNWDMLSGALCLQSFQFMQHFQPRRCQRITVSGLTTLIAFRIQGNSWYSQTKISRSVFLSHTRDRDLRLRTITCCRRTRFSASSLARDFSRDRTTSKNLIRKSTIGRSIITVRLARHPGSGFRYRRQ